MKYNIRLQVDENIGIITLDVLSKDNVWKEVTIKKGEQLHEDLLELYKLNPHD